MRVLTTVTVLASALVVTAAAQDSLRFEVAWQPRGYLLPGFMR